MGNHPGHGFGCRYRSVAAAFLSLLTAAGFTEPAKAVGDPGPSAEFREPVTLASKDGVLEVRLTAHQGAALLDTAAKPVQNFLLFDYQLIRGTASDGKMVGANPYPSPTLQVFPGETLIVHLDNALTGLTIADYFSPQYTEANGTVPTYPIQMTSSPLNLHVHGIHVTPKGNGDNVMLHVPAGMSNTYVYDIPKNMPQGAYWYHSHLHTLTAQQTYLGLAGLLSIGRTDGNLPVVTDKRIPIRNMLLQYNGVFDRAGGSVQLNNLNWPQFVSTLVPPKADELIKGTYRPLLAPVDFARSKPGTTFATVWYSGPLSIRNNRGFLQAIPSNLQTFTPDEGQGGKVVPADPSLPDSKRDVQFTVNGQFQPTIKSKPGQTEIWVLANISDYAYMSVRLTETATGRHPPIAIVGQDGNPSTTVHYPAIEDGTRLVISPASRYAIAVTMPAEGELILEMPPLGNGAKTVAAAGILYTSNGTANPPAVLGSVSVLPSAISYVDGFFAFPSQVLAKAVPTPGKGVTTAFAEGQPLGAYTSFIELGDVKPDVTRKLVISGGFLNDKATLNEPKAFVYAFDGAAFPNMPLIQPRLDSVEEWKFVNNNNDEHPIHIHVNDFEIVETFDPTTGLRTAVDHWGVDNINVPAPLMKPDEGVIQPGLLSLRMRFDEYTGLFVMHCHRLNHEDNGLMALVNVIPAMSTYAAAVPGGSGRPTEVHLFDGKDDRQIATLIPFPGYEGDVSVAIGDIDGDGVYDLVVGSGRDHAPEVVAYAGRSAKGMFGAELARFQPFPADAKGGISVTAAQIDGSSADNIVVASGPGMPSEVRVYGAKLPAMLGMAPPLFSTFKPYADDTSGVTLTSGFVDFATGRNSLVTAAGADGIAMVKVFVFPLTTPVGGKVGQLDKPVNTTSFLPFGPLYRGGVSLGTGWLAGSLGGAKRIIVSQLADKGTVKVYSSGLALDGGPAMYVQNPSQGDHVAAFREIASFEPVAGGTGTRIATTSTTTGANLLASSVSPEAATILKFDFARADAKATVLKPIPLGQAISLAGAKAVILGGD